MWKSVLCLLLVSIQLRAADLTAVTCNASDVQAKIDLAASGDKVIVPPGNCTWSTRVNISGKALTLQGAGIGQTNITDNTTDAGAKNALNIACSDTNFVDVSGFTFITGGAKSTNSIISIDGPSPFNKVGFRLHHNRLSVTSTLAHVIEPTGVQGLIDHNTFDVTATGSVQSISPSGSPDPSDGGFTPWSQAESLGTINAVYIEQNTFNYCTTCTAEDAIDGYGGARVAIRHNTFNNAHVGFHGTDSGNRRSLFSFEIYENDFFNTSSGNFRALTVRGGTGVVFNNRYTGGAGHTFTGINLMLYRACGLDQSGWGACSGINYAIGSSNFSANESRQTHVTTGAASSTNVLFQSDHPDTVCISGANCTAFFDGAGSPNSGMCRDQPGKTHDQATDPVTVWNNDGQDAGTYDGGTGCSIDSFVVSGRDYVNNGTTPKTGYSAFTFPHPLQGAPATHRTVSGSHKIGGGRTIH